MYLYTCAWCWCNTSHQAHLKGIGLKFIVYLHSRQGEENEKYLLVSSSWQWMINCCSSPLTSTTISPSYCRLVNQWHCTVWNVMASSVPGSVSWKQELLRMTEQVRGCNYTVTHSMCLHAWSSLHNTPAYWYIIHMLVPVIACMHVHCLTLHSWVQEKSEGTWSG